MQPRPYGPFKYTPVNPRPNPTRPGGPRVALWGGPNIEVFAPDRAMPGDSKQVPAGQDGTLMVRHWSQRDYGNRVGVFRVMECLERHGMRSTVALNSDVCDMHPEIIEECLKLGWEFMGHNRTNTQRLTEAPKDQERALIRHVLDRIPKPPGNRPVRCPPPGLHQPLHTPAPP